MFQLLSQEYKISQVNKTQLYDSSRLFYYLGCGKSYKVGYSNSGDIDQHAKLELMPGLIYMFLE